MDAEWEPAVDLSEAGKQGMDAVVVLDAPGDANAADGHATAVWISQESVDCAAGKEAPCSSDTVQAAGYDPDGIPAVEIEAPAEAVVGEPVEISTAKENTPAQPSAEPTPSVTVPSLGCVQAEAARDRARRRLKLASAKSSRADGPAEARLPNAEKRRQAAALHQARRHLAACN